MQHTNLAVMSFDGIHLLLPQQSVATIEVANSIADKVDAPNAVGSLKCSAGVWPVFALTAEFKVRNERPSAYRFCVGFNRDEREVFSLACEEVSTLSVDNVDQLKPVHTCMRTLSCPIESLLLKDNKLSLVSGIEAMYQFLLHGTLIPEVAQA